ncbi:MAG TPA: 16S rRNA (guanine(966)-N(2))-methyltransferase RsmD [Thermodesulfobacteriota bacterium]|nr:16S rRNA (guanine(966)-N(2))-methyltransferase RsmD [Thermodesulfobacteriota bacterium]
MLHVLTGSHKGRKLKVPKGQKIRPTTSRVKKSIFDRLGDISGLRVLDIFAGSGGLGIESLSRGASHVTFIEKDASVFKILIQNIADCGLREKATLICAGYEQALKSLSRDKEGFDIIFMDPPYKLYETLKVGDFIESAAPLLNREGLIVIEHDHKISDTPPGFTRFTKPFGGTHLSFFRRSDECVK